MKINGKWSQRKVIKIESGQNEKRSKWKLDEPG